MFVKVEKVSIQDYGDFHLRRGSALLRLRASEILADESKNEIQKEHDVRSLIVYHCLVDDKGNRVFESPEKVLDCDRAFVDAVAERAAEMNKASAEDSVKNSEPSPIATSPAE